MLTGSPLIFSCLLLFVSYFTAHSLFSLVRGQAGFQYRESNSLFIIAKILSFLSLKALCMDPEGDIVVLVFTELNKKRKSNFWK